MPKQPSPAQSAASKKNGAKGRGPLSAETKARSAQNARKWGLFGKTVALPHELPQWAERSGVWHTYYQASSPASMHLTNECARATLKADRCASYEQSTIEEQTQTETQKWKVGQKRKTNRLAKELRGQPQATVQKLQSFGDGTRFMISCFDELIGFVQHHGHLTQENLNTAICLFGVAPTPQRIHQDLMAYVITLYNLGCTPEVSSTVVEEFLKPENRPDVLQALPADEVFGSDADENRELLVGELTREGDRLRAVAARLEREVDGPRLVAILERAAILTEEAARRLARSHSEARTTYHRASSALWPMLEREKEEGSPESAEDDHDDNQGTKPAFEPISGVPVSACRDEASETQIEPEDPSVALAQTTHESGGSVEGRPAEPERQNGVFSPAPALENTPSEARAQWGGSEGEGIPTGPMAQPAPDSVEAVPVPAGRAEAKASQIEPEDPAGALVQRVDDLAGSVEGRLSATERQNGVFRPAPVLENGPSDTAVEGRGPAGSGDSPSVAAPTRPAWATILPLAACRRADSFLSEDEEEAKKGSDQVADTGASPVDGRPPGPGRDEGVSSPALILQEPAFSGVAELAPRSPL